MKLTRRQLAVAAAGSAVAIKGAMKAQAQPAPAAAPATPRDTIARNADTLAKFSIPMSTEPAFQFKA